MECGFTCDLPSSLVTYLLRLALLEVETIHEIHEAETLVCAVSCEFVDRFSGREQDTNKARHDLSSSTTKIPFEQGWVL
jgi:hypothetical protein